MSATQQRWAPATKDLAKALYIQGVKYSVISATAGVPEGVLRSWAHRYKWRALVANAAQVVKNQFDRGLAVATANNLQAMGDQIRAQLSQELVNQAALLANEPPRSVADLGTTKHGQGRASVVKTIAESAALVHDWGNDIKTGLVLVGELSREPEPAAAVIDIQTIAAAPEEPPAGVDTTTGSVQEPAADVSSCNPLQ